MGRWDKWFVVQAIDVPSIRIFAKNFARFYEKIIILGASGTWSHKSFVPSSQWASILYCRLSDFCFLKKYWVVGNVNTKKRLDKWNIDHLCKHLSVKKVYMVMIQWFFGNSFKIMKSVSYSQTRKSLYKAIPSR